MSWSERTSFSCRLGLSTLCLAALVACGGGGGGDKAAAPGPAINGENVSPQAVSTAREGDKIRLGGIVSKGRVGNAIVRVLAINGGTGVVNEAVPLSVGSTDRQGNYENLEFTLSGSYIVEVQARDCADTSTAPDPTTTPCSFHRDEATGAYQALPSGFAMRALVSTTPRNNRVNVSAFSEWAYQAAKDDSTGTLSSANIDRALNMVNTLMGVADLNAVEPLLTLNDPNATPGQLRLGAMLTAMSKLANDPAALAAISGCGSSTAGSADATTCVVNALATNATLTDYVGRNATLTAALDAQLQTVVAGNDQLIAVVAGTSDKLTDPTMTVPVPGAPSLSVRQRVEAFFSDLTSTIHTLLDSGAAPGEGAFLTEARQLESAYRTIYRSGQVFTKDAALLHMAVRLWSEFDVGSGEVVISESQNIEGAPPTVEGLGLYCALQRADGSAVQSTDAPAQVAKVWCYADYSLAVGASTYNAPTLSYTNARNGYHWVEVTRSSPTSYSYDASARLDDVNVDVNLQTNTATFDIVSTACLQSTASINNVGASCGTAGTASGTVTPTFSGSGTARRLASITINGNLPDDISPNGEAAHGTGAPEANLARYTLNATVTLSDVLYTSTGTSTPGGFSDSQLKATVGLGGTLLAYPQGLSGALESTFTVRNNSLMTVEADELYQLRLDTVFETPSSFKIEGVLTADRTPELRGTTGTNNWDTGTGSFVGKVYNKATDASQPVLQGSLTVGIDNSRYDPTLPLSTSNYYVGVISADLFITAPNHPKLRLIAKAAGKRVDETVPYSFGFNSADAASGALMVYNTDGSVRRDINMSVYYPALDGQPWVTFADGVNGIAFTAKDGVTTADLLVDTFKAGLVNGDDSRVTLTDGSFFTLDFGTIQY